MKTYILGAAAVLLISGSAFAMEAPVVIGDYSANVLVSENHRDDVDLMTTASMRDVATHDRASIALAPIFPWDVPGGR